MVSIIAYRYYYSIEGFFPPDIKAGFTTGMLDGFDVESDMQKVFKMMGTEIPVAYLDQKHSGEIQQIEKPGLFTGDGLFTKKSKLALIVKSADCLPLFFHHTPTDTIGLMHMGWRSAQAGILDQVPFDCKKAKVFAGVGLRKCCFKVGEFIKYSRLAPFVERTGIGLKYDPIALAKADLMKKNLKDDNFHEAAICSLCDRRNFFSYRRDKTEKRTLSFIFKT